MSHTSIVLIVTVRFGTRMISTVVVKYTDKITGHRIHFLHSFLQGVDINNHCQYSPMAAGEQEGKAWLRIMRTHNS